MPGKQSNIVLLGKFLAGKMESICRLQENYRLVLPVDLAQGRIDAIETERSY